jgi:hypothetical protein
MIKYIPKSKTTFMEHECGDGNKHEGCFECEARFTNGPIAYLVQITKFHKHPKYDDLWIDSADDKILFKAFKSDENGELIVKKIKSLVGEEELENK